MHKEELWLQEAAEKRALQQTAAESERLPLRLSPSPRGISRSTCVRLGSRLLPLESPTPSWPCACRVWAQRGPAGRVKDVKASARDLSLLARARLRGSRAVPGSAAQRTVSRWRCVASKPHPKQDPVPYKMGLSVPTKQFCFLETARRKTWSPLVTRSQAGQGFPQHLLLGHNIEMSIMLLKPSNLNLSLFWVSNPAKLFCLI